MLLNADMHEGETRGDAQDDDEPGRNQAGKMPGRDHSNSADDGAEIVGPALDKAEGAGFESQPKLGAPGNG